MTNGTTSENKRLVWDFWQQLSGGNSLNLETIIRTHVHADISWNGPHPINYLQDTDALVADFWEPLFHSFPDIKRRSDVFMGGRYSGHDWVCATGNFTGTFDQDWLDIPATGSEIQSSPATPARTRSRTDRLRSRASCPDSKVSRAHYVSPMEAEFDAVTKASLQGSRKP